jgi:hypothetical protein
MDTSHFNKEIVDEIYARAEKLEYDIIAFTSNVMFMKELDLLSFIPQKDFESDLYDHFIAHAREIYQEKFAKVYRKHSNGILKDKHERAARTSCSKNQSKE